MTGPEVNRGEHAHLAYGAPLPAHLRPDYGQRFTNYRCGGEGYGEPPLRVQGNLNWGLDYIAACAPERFGGTRGAVLSTLLNRALNQAIREGCPSLPDHIRRKTGGCSSTSPRGAKWTQRACSKTSFSRRSTRPSSKDAKASASCS
jgi:hypothetical protein